MDGRTDVSIRCPVRGAIGPLLALIVVAGCGVTTQSQPQLLKSHLPATAAPPLGAATRLTDLYLVRSDQLVVAARPVPDPVTLQRIIQTLLQGPTDAEGEKGLRSALPTTVLLRAVSVQRETAVVDLSDGLTSIDSADQALAIAQLVYTCVTWPGVSSLQIKVEGKAVQLPRADGTLTQGVVTPADYSSLLRR